MLNSSDPEPCSPFSYCPNGTINPIQCPDGQYTDNSTTGLERADDCPYCPAGNYICQIFKYWEGVREDNMSMLTSML